MIASEKQTEVRETNLPLPLVGRGKVRDIYAVGSDKLLIVVTDRLSAFDVVLPNPILFKGAVLNQISLFWFDYFKNLVPNHVIGGTETDLPKNIASQFGSDLKGRFCLVKKAKPLPVECVVRGYITGSGWKDYQKTGTICGHQLPANLKQCAKLEEPLFTPSTKATVGHDENINFEKAIELVGRDIAEKIKKVSIELYLKGREYAEGKGILIADTKFEFGILNNELILIDEVLTPDSSRFWPKDGYEPGKDQPSFDKQIVRNYLLELKWNQKPPAPTLPDEIVKRTSDAYRDVYHRLTGKTI